MLLVRDDLPAIDAIERLVGMQAQIPNDPYIGLWTRLKAFEPDELASLVLERRAARIHLMRWTIHLVTARDVVALRPLLQPVLDQRFTMGSPFGRQLRGIDLDELVKTGRSLVGGGPLTFAELRALLAERWPEYDAESMARAVVTFVPVVQVPPRGLWGAGGRAKWLSAEVWLGRPLDPNGERLTFSAPGPMEERSWWSGPRADSSRCSWNSVHFLRRASWTRTFGQTWPDVTTRSRSRSEGLSARWFLHVPPPARFRWSGIVMAEAKGTL